MKAITQHIPNTLTSLNLFSGCLAITFAFRGSLDIAAYCIFIAAVFDFFDGFLARLLKAYSPLGVQLDSLADMVSFGVAPAVMLHTILYGILAGELPENMRLLVSFAPFILAVFSGLRLAKFNIDTRQSETFIGLTTTATGLLIASTVLSSFYVGYITDILASKWVIIISAVILSFLLVSEIPMFSLKFKKQASWSIFFKKYTMQVVFLILCLLSPIFFGVFFIGAMILLYIVFSVGLWLVKPKKIEAVNK